MKLPDTISNVTAMLSHLPGVGEKTALRYSLNFSTWSSAEVDRLVDALKELQQLRRCIECGFFTDENLCEVCRDQGRDIQSLCIVESVTDCLAVEKSRYYRGLYHVLGGTLNPLIGVGPDNLNIKSIVDRVNKNGTKNVILALNPSVEGDATCAYIAEILPESVKVDRIGFGVPIGGSLEFVDAMTISKALENRQEM